MQLPDDISRAYIGNSYRHKMAIPACSILSLLCATAIVVMATYVPLDAQPQGQNEADIGLAKQVHDLKRIVYAQSEEVRDLKAVVQSQGEEVRDLKKVVQSQGEEVRDLRKVVQSKDEEMQELKAVAMAQREVNRGLTVALKKQRGQLRDFSVVVQTQRDLIHDMRDVVSDHGKHVTMLAKTIEDSAMFEGSVETKRPDSRRGNDKNCTKDLLQDLYDSNTATADGPIDNNLTHEEQDERMTVESTAVADGEVYRGIRSEAGVAFSAYLSHDLVHMGHGHTIKMDKTLLNDGNAYNAQTGIFTAPVTGVYLFTFTIADVSAGDHIIVRLSVNNGRTVEAIFGTNTNDHWDMAGNTAIVRVSAGQAVWLEAVDWIDADLRIGAGYRFVTFSGYLIY